MDICITIHDLLTYILTALGTLGAIFLVIAGTCLEIKNGRPDV